MKSRRIHAFHREEDVLSYTRLAPLYDLIMDHIDYKAWADYIMRLFKQFGKEVRRVVDGGCGTGSLINALMELGYQAVGFDGSREMIRLARKKSTCPLWQGDLRSIGLSGVWDSFLCIYDTIQYLTMPELESLLTDVKNLLADGGLVIFDVVTESHILKYWAHFSERNRGNGWEALRRSWYDRRERCQHTEFNIYYFQEKKIFKEHHLQSIYRLDEVVEAIHRSGLKLIGRFDGFTLNPGSEASDRVHFVLRQEEP